MNRVWTTEIGQHVGERIRVAGWLHRFRQLSGVSFLVLRDGKGTAQIIVEEPKQAEMLAQLHAESVLEVIGIVVTEEQAPGGFELREAEFSVVTEGKEPLPFDLYRPTLKAQLPMMLDHAGISLRHPRHRAVFRISAASMSGFRSTLGSLGFVEIQTPKIVGSATEGGADAFTLDYFGRKAFLAQSPQFYKQTLVGVFERVFEVGPVFRAEPHDTARHLSEYVSLDAEMGFITDHLTVMSTVSRTLVGMIRAIEEQAADAVKIVGAKLPMVPDEIPSIHFANALELIFRETGEDAREEPDLAPAHERWLCDWALREFGSEFLFVTGYPMIKRPFYTYPEPKNPRYSNSFDLLFRGLELITGGQRLHLYEDYVDAITVRGMTVEGFASYLEPFKHGMPPHGGFAIGLERWVARLIGAQNIRETTLFPRDLHRVTP